MTQIKSIFESRSPLLDVRNEGVHSNTPNTANASETLAAKPMVPVTAPAPTANKAAQQSAEAVRKQLEVAVSRLKEYADAQQRELNFSIDEGSEQLVIKVFNANTGELVRQIPNEEALKLAEQFSVPDSGALFDSIV